MDPCCFTCKGAHGICLTRGLCDHHVLARAQDDANHRARRTHRDPTGDAAVANAMRDRRPQQRRPFNYPKEDR